jgi:predicted phage terminase large subunit-like protein
MPASSSPTSSASSSAAELLHLPPQLTAAVIQDMAQEGRLRDLLQLLNPTELHQLLTSLPDALVQTLLYDWVGLWGRQSQLVPPGDWNTWLILAGRGFGKTRTGAETVRLFVEQGLAKRIALVAPTAADVRDVMVEGDSGLLSVCPPWFKAHFEPSKRRITWKRGGKEVARATLFSAEEPERFRGPQHDLVWGDEPASWLDPDEAWAQLQMGLRLGKKPRAIITGTPKPIDLILKLLEEEKTGDCYVTRGSTYENSANLAANFISQITRLYGNTRLGEQEIRGGVLLDVAGAIFNLVAVSKFRVPRREDELPAELAQRLNLVRIVVAVDPAQTSENRVDQTGIVVEGLSEDGHGYVLEDASMRGSPDEWARTVSRMFHKWGASEVIAEVNVGGEMVAYTMKTIDESMPVKAVRAMRGKAKRAEPIAALIEQGKIHLVGEFAALEKQMKVFTGINGKRDDRCDAMCWGFHDLIVGREYVGLV